MMSQFWSQFGMYVLCAAGAGLVLVSALLTVALCMSSSQADAEAGEP